MHSYRNIRFVGTCQVETPQPIIMQFCLIDNVGEITAVLKIVGIGWPGHQPRRVKQHVIEVSMLDIAGHYEIATRAKRLIPLAFELYCPALST
jgi:hypothetical protein